MRTLAAAVISLSGFLAAGCFDIEESLTLEKNLSGKAGFSMKIDMEPMVGFMIKMQREQGKPGEPTAAELAQARKEFLASGKTTTTSDFEKEKKEFQSKLPKGVTLLDASFKEDGLKIAANFLFGFDQASKLRDIKFPKKGEPGQPDPAGNPVESPFEGLQVIDEGKTLLVTSPPQNPMADAQGQAGQMPVDAAMKKQMAEMFKGLRVAFKITAPFEIVEHTAHRKEGTTLVWEYDVKTLEKLTPEQTKQGIKVRYRK